MRVTLDACGGNSVEPMLVNASPTRSANTSAKSCTPRMPAAQLPLDWDLGLCSAARNLALARSIGQTEYFSGSHLCDGSAARGDRMSRLFKFFALPVQEQCVLLEAGLSLGLARLILCVPFRWLVPLIGRPQPAADRSSAAMLSPERRAAALVVRRALLCLADRLPWHSSCLVCALAGRVMLWRRRLPSVLHLGVRTGAPMAELSAHAWLRCGDIDVVGVEIAADYTPIVAFRA